LRPPDLAPVQERTTRGRFQSTRRRPPGASIARKNAPWASVRSRQQSVSVFGRPVTGPCCSRCTIVVGISDALAAKPPPPSVRRALLACREVTLETPGFSHHAPWVAHRCANPSQRDEHRGEYQSGSDQIAHVILPSVVIGRIVDAAHNRPCGRMIRGPRVDPAGF
jgi:hypothetical protein